MTNNGQLPQNTDSFWKLIQSIMMDYEQLANAHNTLIKALYNKGLISNEDMKKAAEQAAEETKKLKEKVAKSFNVNNVNQSKIIKP